MTPAEISSMLGKLKGLVREQDFLKRAEKSLAEGDEGSARMDMAEAIRGQIEYVKKYDTTGRLAAQAQELRHVRTKLLKGTTWSECKKSFGRYCEIFHEVAAEKDTIMVKTLGWCVRPFVWIGSTLMNIDPVAADDFVHNTRLVTYAYAPFKTLVRWLCDREGRRHFATMCKGIYRTGRDVAKTVWEGTKAVCRETAKTAARVAKSGYAIAKSAATSFAESVKSVARSAASTAVKVGQAVTGFVGRLFA